MKNGGESVRHQRDWGVRAAEACAAAAPKEAGVWENSLWPSHESGLSIPSCTGSFGARIQLVVVPSLPQMQRLSHGSVSTLQSHALGVACLVLIMCRNPMCDTL